MGDWGLFYLFVLFGNFGMNVLAFFANMEENVEFIRIISIGKKCSSKLLLNLTQKSTPPITNPANRYKSKSATNSSPYTQKTSSN